MVELNALVVVGVPTAIGAIMGAVRTLAKEMKAERIRVADAPVQGAGSKIAEVLKADYSDSAWNVGWGAFIGAVYGLAIGVVLSCTLWFANSIFGAKESADTIRRMVKRSRTSSVQEDGGSERVKKPARAPAKLAFADNQNYGQWMALERKRRVPVQMQKLGKSAVVQATFTAGSRRVG